MLIENKKERQLHNETLCLETRLDLNYLGEYEEIINGYKFGPMPYYQTYDEDFMFDTGKNSVDYIDYKNSLDRVDPENYIDIYDLEFNDKCFWRI